MTGSGPCDNRPFALLLYDRWMRGETVEQLAAELKIPPERVAARIRVAQIFFQQQDPKEQGN